MKIDADYRKPAEAGKLHKIAPRRYNPCGEAWLPVLHTKRQGWTYAALFSNTTQAHDLGKTSNWAVIYYEHDGEERQTRPVLSSLKGRCPR
jgi:DNA polymerase (family X)